MWGLLSVNKQIYLEASAIIFSKTNIFFLPIGRKDGQDVFDPMPVHFPPIKRLDVAFMWRMRGHML